MRRCSSKILVAVLGLAAAAPVSAAVPLKEAAPNSGDQQGFAVALSADGTLALVGAPGATVNGQALAGKAYLYALSQRVWKRVHEFADPAGAGGDQFGGAVALSGDGGTAVIGAPATAANNGGGAQGRAYAFTSASGAWTAHPLPEPGAAAVDAFGSAVAVSADGGVAVVGAPGFGNNLGKAYAFKLGGGIGAPRELNDPATDAGNARFGSAIAVAAGGGAVLIGAPTGVGTAYLFTGRGLDWSMSRQFANPVADIPGNFGASVALSADGGAALIGAPGASANPDNDGRGDGVGAAYLFARSGGAWGAPAVLGDPAAARLENFGGSVALSGGAATAAVGALNAPASGAVFSFKRTGDGWSQVRKIKDPAPHADAGAFGNAVALSADGATLLAGADNTGVEGKGGAGIAYVLPPVIVLAVTIKTDPPAPAAGKPFRYRVSVTNTDAVVTATHVGLRVGLQSAVAFDLPSDPACGHSATELACRWPTLAPGASREIALGVSLTANAARLAEKAAAESDQTDPRDPRNRASLETDVPAAP